MMKKHDDDEDDYDDDDDYDQDDSYTVIAGLRYLIIDDDIEKLGFLS